MSQLILYYYKLIMEKRYTIGLIDDEENSLEILAQEISMLPGFEVGFSTDY